MDTDIKTIKNIKDYIEIVTSFDILYGFRGVSNLDYLLIPGIGRVKEGIDRGEFFAREHEMFSEFSRKLVQLEKGLNSTEVALFAQHYGLPTRLLDWTTNPLVALYFSVASSARKDGIVYVMKQQDSFLRGEMFRYGMLLYGIETSGIYEEFEGLYDGDGTLKDKTLKYHEFLFSVGIEKICQIEPTARTARIATQSSFFTLHIDPFSPIKDELVLKIIIPASIKNHLRCDLRYLGIHEYSLFPDIGGLAAMLKHKHFAKIFS